MVTLQSQIVGQVGPYTLHLYAVYLQRPFSIAELILLRSAQHRIFWSGISQHSCHEPWLLPSNGKLVIQL